MRSKPSRNWIHWVFTAMMVWPTVVRAAYSDALDLSSPKSAAKSLYEAVDRGDADAIRQILLAQSDPQRDVADAFARLILSSKNLADAAKKRYGGAADAIAQGALPMSEIEQLDTAIVKETGDTATLQTKAMIKPMTFRRTAAGWQVEVADLTAAPDKVAAQVTLTRDFADVFARIADDINAGKLATVQDAETAIQQQINEVMVRAARTNPPATRPASQPPDR